jgi:branched-chain amino acid transport system substrate-binding protein
MFPTRTTTLFLSLSFLFTMVLGGCGAKPDQAREIRIGVIYPLSGTMAAIGEDQKKGMELAAEIVNGKYDLELPLGKEEGLPNLGGAKIKLIFADSQGMPEVALREAERLISQEKVVVLMGAYSSSTTAPASQVAERKGIPFVNAESTRAELTERGFKWFFRLIPHDRSFAEKLFVFLGDVEKKKGVQVGKIGLAYENSLFGQGAAGAEKKFAAAAGRQISVDIPYPKETADATSEVLKLKAAGVNTVMMTSYIADAILYQKAFKELKYSPAAIIGMEAGHVAPDFVKNLGPDAEYVMTSATWSADLIDKKPIVRKVNEVFKQKYGADMSGYVPHSFTALMVVADAVNRAGSTEPEKIRAALKATDYPGSAVVMPWEGVRFDDSNQNMYGTNVVLQIQGGKYWTVWPFEVASREIVWPMPAWDAR